MNTRHISKITKLLFLGVILCVTAGRPSQGQEEPESPAHNELRALRTGLVDAVNANDLEKLLSFLHENVVITWLDGDQSRGHEQVRAYYKSKTEGESAIVKSFSVEPAVKELSFLYGDDTAVAYGTAITHFQMRGGQQLDVDGCWTATMVKDGDKWNIVAFHSSAGMFDNPLLLAVERFALWGIGIAGVVGVILGWAVPKLVRRMRGKPEVAPA